MEDFTKFLIENWQIIAGLIGSAVAYKGGLHIQQTNEKTAELENLKTVREMEKGLVDDMKAQVDKLVEVNDYLKRLVEEQTRTINSYKLKYGELEPAM